MALRGAQFDQAAATDRGADIHVCSVDIPVDVSTPRGADIPVCSVDIRVDVQPGRVFNGPGVQWGGLSRRRAGIPGGEPA